MDKSNTKYSHMNAFACSNSITCAHIEAAQTSLNKQIFIGNMRAVCCPAQFHCNVEISFIAQTNKEKTMLIFAGFLCSSMTSACYIML